MVTAVQKQTRPPLKERLTKRIKLRILAKRGPMTPPFTLEYRHIFILPTRFGFGFGFMLFFMALGGLNFNNNMALMLVFLLGTIAQMTTLIAYRNMIGLKFENISVEPVFSGEPAVFNVFISNAGERQRYALQAGFSKPQDCQDFSLHSSEALLLKMPTGQRGWLTMPSFKVETRFPLGLFRAWSWIFPDIRCLVYPSPAKNAPPLPNTGHGDSGLALKGEGDQIHGLRKYQQGDSLQRVAWRASARHDELYSLEMETPMEEACELDWATLTGMDIESRLSILTAWVMTADRKHMTYSLSIPGSSVAAGQGVAHRAACLELLALFH